MNTETILEILRLAIDDVRDSRKYSQEIGNEFLNEKLDEAEGNLWILHTKINGVHNEISKANLDIGLAEGETGAFVGVNLDSIINKIK